MYKYEIVVRAHLHHFWEHWFGDFQIEHLPNGDTKLWGELPDQAAVYGIISMLRDLNLQLISVQKVPETRNNRENEPVM